MAIKKRLALVKVVNIICTDYYENSLEEFRKIIDEAEKNGATNVRGREETGYYGDTSNYLEFYKMELENDEEYSLRVEKQKALEIIQDDWDRITYERLKKKFEE